MIPRRVQLAILIAFVCHGFFILTARYRLSYDAYTHMLFANHYAENWFSLWEPRWYTGFTVVSYPPLTHQLIALFIPLVGFDAALALILWAVVTLYPLGVYTFSSVFAGKSAASYAALSSAILLPIYVAAYIFGQLPFLTSTLFALFSAASLACYLRRGGFQNLALTIALVATTMASHHATLIFQPFLYLAVVLSQINKDNWRTVVFRGVIFGTLALAADLAIIWPFWEWGSQQSIQTPIDHLSRHNFIMDPLAIAIFFFPLYGPLVVVIPFLFRKWTPRLWGLLAAFFTLFLLGLGGTTPLPRLFFGKAWEWLTYDRFAFWACLTLTPFFGILFLQLKRRWKNRFILQPIPVTLRRNFLSAVTFFIFAATSLASWFAPLFFATQPKPIDMQPIVNFLNKGDRSQWRYLTFGFGNQYAYLNLLTKATTIDGSYHTARTLPELRTSGIAEVDTVYWTTIGVSALEPILKESSRHGVRWGFVDPATLSITKIRWGEIHSNPYTPLLEKLGWSKLTTLSNDVQIWENPNAVIPKVTKPPTANPLAELSWGTLPLLSLISTISLGTLRLWPIEAERVIRNFYSFVVGLIPISLCFWVYRSMAHFLHPPVYFIYTDPLFFISDALAVLAIILWLTVKISRPANTSQHVLLSPRFSLFMLPLLSLFVLSTLSTLWSQDWRISLYISLHFWLVFFLILSLRDWHVAWRMILFGLCSALVIQLVMGFIGYALQSTAFLETLNMKWPGILDPSIRGASVVQLANGLRILRAYGTFPHPNILGGFAVLTLLGPIGLFFTSTKPNYAALILYSLGIILIALTFSRSAWLGLVALIIILIMKAKYVEHKRLYLFVATSFLASALTLYPLRNLVFIRISNAPVETEEYSAYGRTWLSEQAWEVIRQHPVLGVGIGSFILQLAKSATDDSILEPVHNMLLLAGSELGIVGLLLVLILFISIALNIIKAKTPQGVLAGATIAGLGVISFFDHYLWTLAPGRIMLGLALGLWLGQNSNGA